ncbi:SAF domain-containing protein [Glycomyces sp. L485]|uniref:SAF domain-containing protein n=1 Tax=Glycomyces sp. L485 TaxID=2909235 RepID=UPI001F4B5091|nr:SAF domain-containing protein [Glycomyces sp. L485]
MATPLAAGQVIGQDDLDQVEMNAEDAAGLGLVPVERAGEVVGQVAAVPLREGTLLSAAMVGQPQVPRAGYVEVTVALADGRWPSRVQSGQSVSLIAESASSAEGAWSARATVLEVDRPESGGALVTVELPTDSAAGLALAESATLFMVAIAPDRASTSDEETGTAAGPEAAGGGD